MQHRYAVHAISRFIEHYGNGIRADDATAGWFAPLRDAVLAAESEVIPVVDDAEQAEALVTVALDLIDLSLTGPGLDKPHRKAREAVRRYLERIGEVVVDRERVRDEITAAHGLLGEVLNALGHQGGTRQQALDEIRRLRAGSQECPSGANPLLSPPQRTRAAFDEWGVGPQTSESLSGQDTPTHQGVEPPSESAPEPVAAIVSDEASSRVEWLAALPIGTITVYVRLGMVSVRLPDGWDVAVGSEGVVYGVAPSPGMEPLADEDVVRLGDGTVPDSWLTSHAEVAKIARAWLVERGFAVASSLASDPLAPIDTDDDCPI